MTKLIGPWFVGYVVGSHIGICFLWGMIVDGSYLPGGFTYIMGALLVSLTFILYQTHFNSFIHSLSTVVLLSNSYDLLFGSYCLLSSQTIDSL